MIGLFVFLHPTHARLHIPLYVALLAYCYTLFTNSFVE